MPYAILQQRHYVHRRLKNLIINEIRVELLNTNNDVTYVILHNDTNLQLDYRYASDPYLNPNKYAYFRQEGDPENNMVYEQRVIKMPTYLSPVDQLNDGI